MQSAIPLIVAGLVSIAIIVIGGFYIASPERVTGSFGLSPLPPTLIRVPGFVSRESATLLPDSQC